MQNFRKLRLGLFMVLICLVLGSSKVALANDLILSDLSGQSVNLSSYKGKQIMLFFWTTWCPYCRKELKILNEQYSVIAKEGILIVGVNVGESMNKVQRFFKGYQLNFRMLLDKDGFLADKYDLMGVPTYVFLDKSGEVILQTNNLPVNYKSLFLERRLK